MNNILPTLRVLHEHYPSIITNDTCLFCNEEKESLIHLTECPQLKEKWQTIIIKTLDYTIDKTKQVLDISLSNKHMQHLLLQHYEIQNIFNPNLCIDILRGFLPKQIINT